jgi:HSP20 family protein
MMSLMKREPFGEMLTLRDAIDRLFAESFIAPRSKDFFPNMAAGAMPVDVYENEDEVIVEASLPGFKPEEIEISLTGDTVTIKGEAKREREIKEQKYHQREMQYGSFSRSLTIPSMVVADKAEAKYEDGILKLTLPKAEEAKEKTIKIIAG